MAINPYEPRTFTAMGTTTQQPQQRPSIGQYTQDLMRQMEPSRRMQETRINQNYNQSSRALREAMAQQGLSRGDTSGRSMLGMEMSRNQAHSENNADIMRQALAQALPYAQMDQQRDFQEAQLTGNYNGQQTLAAQELAQRLAQQALANKYTEAGLTGRFQDGQGSWVDTLAGRQLKWSQDNARDLLASQLWSSYLQNAANAAVPQTAVDWINQMFRR